MAYSVTQLITNAYYLSEVVARSYQTVSGEQLSDGLLMLNKIISQKNLDSNQIPFYSFYDLTVVIGQEEYDIPNLIEPETVTFVLNTVRYSMQEVDRRNYFGQSRANNINSLPFSYNFLRTLNGSKLYIYFNPDQGYPFRILGKFALLPVVFGQDLSLTYETNYISYFEYALAKYICDFNNKTLTPSAQQELKRLENLIVDQDPIDFVTSKLSTLQGDVGYGWAFINLGRGFVPP